MYLGWPRHSGMWVLHTIIESEVVHFFSTEINCFLDILGVSLPQVIDDDTTIDDVMGLDISVAECDLMLSKLFPDYGLEGDMTILDAMSEIFHQNPTWPIRVVH